MLVEDTLIGRYEEVEEKTRGLLDKKMIHTEYVMLKDFFVNGPVSGGKDKFVVCQRYEL